VYGSVSAIKQYLYGKYNGIAVVKIAKIRKRASLADAW
jgi:hypothetical protein